MKEKRNINGIKDNDKNYKGNVKSIVTKVIAVALSLGLALSAAEAIRMYNEWRASKNPEVGIENVQKEISFDDVENIVKQYRDAFAKNDLETIEKLDKEVKSNEYFGPLYEAFKQKIVEDMGYDFDKVDIVAARDGYFLVDREKAALRSAITSNGTINSFVKFIGEDGKNPSVPYEVKEMLRKLSINMSTPSIRDIEDLDEHYKKFEELKVQDENSKKIEEDIER